MHEYIFVFVQKYIHRVRPRDRFLAPPGPPINFVYDQISIYLVLIRLSHFLGRALLLGQAMGPSAAATG